MFLQWQKMCLVLKIKEISLTAVLGLQKGTVPPNTMSGYIAGVREVHKFQQTLQYQTVLVDRDNRAIYLKQFC